MTVTSPGRLNHAVHSGRKADHLLKGNIHTGLYDLGGNTDHFSSGDGKTVQRRLQRHQFLPPMGYAHGSRQMKPLALRQPIKEERRLFFRIADHQETIAAFQCFPHSGRTLLQLCAPCVLNFRAFKNIPQCPWLGR